MDSNNGADIYLRAETYGIEVIVVGVNASHVQNIKDRLEVLRQDGMFVLSKMDEMSEWAGLSKMSANFALAGEFATRVVVGVEYIKTESGAAVGEFITSEEAQIAAEEYIDGLIKLPKWLEFADDIIIRGAIKTVVAYYNGKYGNDWDVGTKEKAKKFIEENIKDRSEGK